MSEKRNVKVKLWVYAVVLFTSAFVVLLITAYSQIKFNRNIDDYRSQIYNNESEKNRFRLNLNTALEDKLKLENELESVKDELSSTNSKVEALKKEISEARDEYISIIDMYEILAAAERDYNDGNFLDCAEKLYTNINPEVIGENGKRRYEFLVQNTYKKASHQLYLEGYSYFKQKLYSAAVKRFQKSLAFADNEYYSDDCYYYIAYSEYKMGNTETAKYYIGVFEQKYPASTLKKNVAELLKLMN